MIFSKRYRYRFGDIDDAGIAYYPKLLHYFHCCFEDWFGDALGIPYARIMHEQKLGLPAVRLEAEFFAPIRYGDEPVVNLGVLRIGNSSVELGFWMNLADGTRPCCRARVITASVDMDTMQKMPLPAEWRTRFEQFLISEADFPAGR
jgi:4-hydroxybenzoyl-CoA thioesterase